MAKCYGCGRTGYECWILPCLVLEDIKADADNGNFKRLNEWAKSVGGKVKRNGQ